MKICPHCRTIKKITEFGLSVKHGRQSWCLRCQASRPKSKKSNRQATLSQFDLTEDQFDALKLAQGGGCAICFKVVEASGRHLSVDHDHVTGKVRGILCRACNVGIGHMLDQPHLLRRAADYLEKASHGICADVSGGR